MTVIIALDVDGVINACPPSRKNKILGTGFDDYEDVEASPYVDGDNYKYPIKYSPSVINQLLDWHQDGLVEIRWLTTWGAGANLELSERLGLPGNFKVVSEPPYGGRRSGWGWWKLIAMQEQPNDEPWVWIDDDLQFDPDALDWVKAQDGRVLGISPDTDRGLTDLHLQLIGEFIATKV